MAGLIAARASRSWRTMAAARARRAMRRATPCSHGPNDSRRRIAPARRTSTRKVAWKESSAAWTSRRIRRQTASTIGPCRVIRTSNAAPAAAPDARNRSSNCAVAQAAQRSLAKEHLERSGRRVSGKFRHAFNPPSHPLLVSAPGMVRLYTFPPIFGGFPWPSRSPRTATRHEYRTWVDFRPSLDVRVNIDEREVSRPATSLDRLGQHGLPLCRHARTGRPRNGYGSTDRTT